MTRVYVTPDPAEPGARDITFVPGENLFTGIEEFARLGYALSDTCSDLLLIAASVFAADRAIPRGMRENISRKIDLSLPIRSTVPLVPLVPTIQRILYRLTHDMWTLELRPTGAAPPPPLHPAPTDGTTLLFSGGLDSLAAAIEFSPSTPSMLLVSHVTRNRSVSAAQQSLSELLQSSGYSHNHWQVFVSSSTSGLVGVTHDAENTQRTRSFLFLVLGAVASIACGNSNLLFIAENGQLAINLPLTQGRIGAFSTHTAHPQVLVDVESLINSATHANIRILNPYVGLTKKEIALVVHRALPDAIPLSTSCWRNARIPPPNHCGQCVPCLVRRIALEAISHDPTAYVNDPWTEDFASLPPDDEGRRNTIDIAEFSRRFLDSPSGLLVSEFPELLTMPIDASGIIAMYRRSSEDALSVLSRYPGLAPILR
ncbi:MAG: 7-cyano-7-deazaguanine synthase [Anaerolineales bacterium]